MTAMTGTSPSPYDQRVDDVVAAFAAEGQALDAFLADLTPEQWQHPSECAGWSVADVVLHLAQTEEAVVSTFEDGNAIRPFAAHLEDAAATIGNGIDDLAEVAVVADRVDDPAVPFARWRAAHAASLGYLAEADPHARLNWIAVPLSARTLTTTRLSEHWIHSMDIREALGDPAPDTDRLAHIARLAWRTLPYAFGLAGEEAPTVQVRLTGPGGDAWVFGDDDAAVHITGPAGDWCRVGARRLAPGDAALVVDGPGGDRVLALARNYA